MKSNLAQDKWLPSIWLRFIVITLLALGIFFRFANFDKKSYEGDEIVSKIRFSGYTVEEIVQDLSHPHIISIKDLQKYQFPSSEKGLSGTIKGLATEEPQLPPLYFVTTRLWMQWLGNSTTVMRSLAAVFSLLSLPCVYWLCLELFESSSIGWVATAIAAISPFHVVYAQHARPYSLWILMILLSSASFLRAIRLKKKTGWGIYTITLIFSFYSYLFSLFIAIAHGTYLIIVEKFRLTKTLAAYLASLFLSILGFSPWLLVLINNRGSAQTATSWQTSHVNPTFIELLRGWILPSSHAFFDISSDPQAPLAYRLITKLLSFVILILIGYSLYFLFRKTSQRIWLFVFVITISTLLPLAVHDLIYGGALSIQYRYLLPCFLGFEFAVAYLLGTKLNNISSSNWQQKLWQFVTVITLSVGVWSCVAISQADFWWTKGNVENSHDLQKVAHLINGTERPLLISDDKVDTLILVSYILDPKVKLLSLEPKCGFCYLKNFQFTGLKIPKIPDGFSDIYLFPFPSKKLLLEIEQEQVYQKKFVAQFHDNILWKLEKR